MLSSTCNKKNVAHKNITRRSMMFKDLYTYSKPIVTMQGRICLVQKYNNIEHAWSDIREIRFNLLIFRVIFKDNF